MGLIALDSRPADFPRVSAAEQAARDAQAERIIAAELETYDGDNPEAQAALEREYEQRFGRPAPVRRGFIPLANAEDARPARGFVPLEAAEPEAPSVMPSGKTILLNNPLTAVGETAANLGTQMVALPAAGLAGLVTEAGRALGVTDRGGADVVHVVGDALTYQPRGEMGQAATEAVMYPFQKLAEAGQWAGGKTLDATGSPIAATAVDTAIQALPMLLAPGLRAGKAGVARVREKFSTGKESPSANQTAAAGPEIAATGWQPEVQARRQGGGESPEAASRGFVPIEEVGDAAPAANRGAGAAETGAGISGPARAAETGAAPDLASPAQRGFATPVQAAAASAVADIQLRAQRAMEVVNERNGSPAGRLDGDTSSLPASGEQRLPLLRRPGDSDGAGMGSEFPAVLRGRGAEAELEALAWQTERQRPLPAGQRGVDVAENPGHALPEMPARAGERPASDGGGGRTEGGFEKRHAEAPPESRMAAGRGADADTAADGPTKKTARWALVEADDLKASHDTNLRPRSENPFGRQGASRHETEMAVQGITHKLNPERLAEAMDDAGGAPIVARDGVVEAGQRRAIALQRIYQTNGQKAENYRQFLRDSAIDFGLRPDQVAAMKNPVLVRLPDEPAPRRAAQTDFSAEGAVRAQNGEPISQAMASEAQHSWAPGQNYVPLRDAMPATAEVPVAAKSAKPIRREDVLRPFLEALDINVYHGRVKGKRLGYYTPKKETLRVKNKSDLEVTAHEVFHALDDRIPAIRAAWRSDKELREQLRSISYDKKSVAEGYAEAGRLYLTNAAELERVAPKVHGWLETFAETHEYGPALRQAQRGMTSWFEQSALDRAKSKIGDPASLNNRGLLPFLSDRWEAMRKGFRQAVVDDLDGVRLAEMDLTGKLAPLGAYETARLSRAAGSITDGAVRFGHPVKKADGSFTYSGKGLEEILRPVAGKLDDFMTYAVGRSARELMQQGREHLFSPAEIRAAVALETPEFTKAWSEYQTWNRGVLDFAESFGILNPETRKLWKRQEYLPFWRVGQGVSGEGAVSGQWAGVKGLKGGTGNLREPLQNMVQNANALITAALKNDARARVVEMIEAEQGGGRFMQKIPAEARPVKIDAKQVQEAVLKDMGIDNRAGLSAEGAKFAALVEKQIAEAPEFYQFFVGGQAPKGKNIVAVMKAGKPEYYEVADPLLLRALQSIDRPAQSWIIKLLGLPKRVGQASIVLDPAFMAANFARDQMMAGIMTQSGFRPIIDAMDGMRHRMTTSPLYREWVANGGGMSSLFLDESAFRAKLEQFYSSQGVDYRTVIDSPRKLLGMIETFGDAFESATRIGEMGRALAKGDHPRHAAYKSREVSVDFSMSGDLPAIRAAYDLIMFLRPTVVSWDRLYRGIANDPNRGVIAAKTAMLGLASAALYLMNRDDPRYADMSDFLKNSHFHVFVGDHHFMIPRPFEPGAIGRVAELAVEKVVNEDAEGLGKDLLRVIGNTFHLNLIPQIAAPLVEQYANKNSFTGAPIETPDHAGLQPFMRAKPGTSETMKAAGMATRDLIPDSMKESARRTWGITDETFQVNPARAEALLRGYLNSWAAYGLLASDRLVVGKTLPEMRADEMPVVRRFYQSEPPKHTKFESQFYSYLNEARRLRGTLKELDEMNLRGLADEKERSPLAGEAKPLERAAKNLGAINNEMQAVRRDANLTPAEKRQQLDALTVERNSLLKEAVLESKKAQKEKTP